jgi:uncharacterized membrane protein YdjX (TVP38/TMEM64 family)
VTWCVRRNSSLTIYIESLLISCLASTICMTLGAILAFLLSRYIFRGFIRKRLIKLHPDFQNYDYAIQNEGALFVFLMQFSLIPYSLLCYLFGGLTRVSLWHFFIGVLGMAVPNLFWSYLGSLIQNLTTQQVDYSYSKIAFMSIGLLLAIYGLKIIQKRAKEQVLLKIPLGQDESTNSSGQLYSPLIQ